VSEAQRRRAKTRDRDDVASDRRQGAGDGIDRHLSVDRGGSAWSALGAIVICVPVAAGPAYVFLAMRQGPDFIAASRLTVGGERGDRFVSDDLRGSGAARLAVVELASGAGWLLDQPGRRNSLHGPLAP